MKTSVLFALALTITATSFKALGQVSTCSLQTHNSYTDFNASSNAGTATTLWFNLHTKLTASQLTSNGDYVMFSGGTLTFNNIGTSFGSSVSLANGKIIADNTVSVPSTSYDSPSNTWITRVPLAYSSSDIFICGAAINSTSGYTVSAGKSNVLTGYFYSNKSFSSQWFYGLACYQPTFTNSTAGTINSVSGVPVSGKGAGTPTSHISDLVAGGSGGGGSNYTGSYSSTDSYTACLAVLNLGSLVWLDINGNGIHENGEAGVGGLTVKLYLDANNDNIKDGAAIATTTTDANGLFGFGDLLPNNYIVGVMIPINYSLVSTNGGDPDNDVDNDNNGLTVIGGEAISNSVSLNENAEPASGVDGDGDNGNLTLAFALNTSGAITLPVKLISFQGNLTKNIVSLNWVVGENEIVDNFQVEKSTDGKNFTPAGLVMGTDKMNSETYQFAETNNTDKIFYRLRMTDKSGVITYSNILVFRTTTVASKSNLTLYNNPVIDKLTFGFQATKSTQVEIAVFDMSGRTQMKQTLNSSIGTNLVSVTLPGAIQSGVYIVNVYVDGANYSAKFVKQ